MAKAKKTAATGQRPTVKKVTVTKVTVKKVTVKKVAVKKGTHKKVSKGAAVKRSAAVTVTSGPVTLAEAEALAKAQAPQRAALMAAAPAKRSATHESVAKERQKLDDQINAENERRIHEYKATMSVMKSRGVKGLAAAAVPAAAAGGLPLQIFAEGDSWFDYPIPFFGGGVVPRLKSLLGVPILSLAKAGDEVRNMLGVEERKILAEQLRNGSPAGGRWDVLLFSGGGNDIVGNPMALWIKDFNATVPPPNLISKERFDAAIELVRAGYEDLITLRDTLSPTTHLVFHGYDFAIPDGRGVCGFGPWMKPTFDLRGFPGLPSSIEVVKAMLTQFAAMLTALASGRSNVTFINTQGTLAPVTSSWHNELHPSSAGFNKIAALFQSRLKSLFPGRVL